MSEKEWLRIILRGKDGESNKRGWWKRHEDEDHKIVQFKKYLGEQIKDNEADWVCGLHETDETYL